MLAIKSNEKWHTRKSKNSLLNNLEHLITITLLKKLYQQLRKNKNLKLAAELESKYAENLEENLMQLIQRIRNGTYRPQPMLFCNLSTTSHLEDKLLQNATRFILSNLYKI